ncbi:MAG: phospho-sugar mutase [Defluviitaleaceae bacterium]|nr:phospho-sugar mutase [Defluviitaleaceae bacterium]
MEYMKRYQTWRDNDAFDEATRAELAAIAENSAEIEERFHQDLEFGTGGLRGVLGAGTNRMNVYTVRRASQGLADYILANSHDGRERGVVVAHDSRRFSRQFALEAALVMVQNGIRAYIFKDLRPTPQLSFTLRRLGCIAGVMITASHNPPEYNGYKAYWTDGGQFVPPQDAEVIACVNKIEDLTGLKAADEVEAIRSGMLTILDESFDDEYKQTVLAQILNPGTIQAMSDDFTIVYTPLNGAGNMPVRCALTDAGFKHIHVVTQQEQPDPNFTTLSYPNPEDPAAFALAATLAQEKNADIIIATDPDADRMGAMVRDANGEYQLLSGNITGVLMAEYVMSQQQQKGILPANAAIVSTIVSTKLTRKIAKHYNAAYYEVLTGFKFIAEKIHQWDTNGQHTFVYGFEESYGYLAGHAARDKDAIIACVLICEIAAWYKSRGMSIFDGIDEIYRKYGYFKDSVRSVTLKGLEGLAKIRGIMANLRENIPASIAGIGLEEFRCYKTSTTHNLITGNTSQITLPTSDVLYYTLADGSWFCVRPSGTEPKIKIYMGVAGDCGKTAQAKLDALSHAVADLIGV